MVVIGGLWYADIDVVESDHGTIFGNSQIRVAQCANRTDGSDIVKRDDRRKFPATLQELLHYRITQLWRCQVTLQFYRELRRNFDTDSRATATLLRQRSSESELNGWPRMKAM